MGRSVVDHGDAERIPRTAIDDEAIPDGQDPAVSVEGDLGVVPLVTGMAGAQNVLAPLFHPADGPAGHPREEGHQHVLGIDVPLDAEAAADIGCNDPDTSFRHGQRGGDLATHPVRDLRGGPDRVCVGASVVFRCHRAALHRHCRIPMVDDATPEGVWSVGEGGVWIAFLHREPADLVRLELFVHQDGTLCQGGLGIDDRVEVLVVDFHRLSGVQCGCPRLGEHHGDGLAYVADFVRREQRLARVEDAVRNRRLPL